MSCWSDDILAITSSDIPITFWHWNTLINFYKQHRNELDEKECQMLLDKSESYRLYLNDTCDSNIERHDVNL